MMVRPTRRMLSAISLGVFCRSAPSTSLIMRSMKVEPAAAVMRTRIQSDNTWVPPVTAERSPPDSRITGADSPVIAASLTEAMPWITSPSPGMISPATHTTRSPARSFSAATVSYTSGLSSDAMRLARVSVRVLRKLSACALPRPSATASAKLANSTVNHSHKTIWKVNPTPALCCTRSRTSKTVVSAVTTSSTKITGFLIRVAGLSLTKAWPIAGPTIFGSKSVETGIRLRSLEVSIAVTPNESVLEQRARGHREVLDERSERERGEEGEAADDNDDADHQADKQAAGGRERAGGRRNRFLFCERTGDRHGRDDH